MADLDGLRSIKIFTESLFGLCDVTNFETNLRPCNGKMAQAALEHLYLHSRVIICQGGKLEKNGGNVMNGKWTKGDQKS